jgi:hypothetical protein
MLYMVPVSIRIFAWPGSWSFHAALRLPSSVPRIIERNKENYIVVLKLVSAPIVAMRWIEGVERFKLRANLNEIVEC